MNGRVDKPKVLSLKPKLISVPYSDFRLQTLDLELTLINHVELYFPLY